MRGTLKNQRMSTSYVVFGVVALFLSSNVTLREGFIADVGGSFDMIQISTIVGTNSDISDCVWLDVSDWKCWINKFWIDYEAVNHEFALAVTELSEDVDPWFGDVNEDGLVTVSDVLLVLKFEGSCWQCDIDNIGDDRVVIIDALSFVTAWRSLS